MKNKEFLRQVEKARKAGPDFLAGFAAGFCAIEKAKVSRDQFLGYREGFMQRGRAFCLNMLQKHNLMKTNEGRKK